MTTRSEELQLEDLPDEVLAHIFQYLSIIDIVRMSGSCGGWKLMTNKDVLRAHINVVEIIGKNIDLAKITRGVRTCNKLLLRNCTMKSSALCNILRDLARRLDSIELIDCSITHPAPKRLFQYIAECPVLTRLSILTSDQQRIINVVKETDLELLLDHQHINVIQIDGLDIDSKFSIIKKLLNKVPKLEFTSLQTSWRRVAFNKDDNTFVLVSDIDEEVFPGTGDRYDHDLLYYPESIISLKSLVYEVVDREGNLVSLLTDDSLIEEYKPSAALRHQIDEQMNDHNGQCFISLVTIAERNVNKLDEFVEAVQENGVVPQPAYWV